MKLKSHAFIAIAAVCLFSAVALRAQQAPVELAREMLKDPWIRELTLDNRITAAKLAKILTARRVDLNGDRIPEFIVSGIGCGNANCPYWIYRKIGDRYVNVPGNLNGIFVRALARRSNGWRDLEFASHSSVDYEPSVFYKFNGSRYVDR